MDQGTTILLIGIAAILIGGFTLYINIRKKIKCTEEIEAEIVEVKRRSYKTGRNRKVDYTPILSFKIDGQEYGGMADVSSILPNKYQVGQTMKLKIDPNSPDDFCVAGKIGDIKWSIFFIALGVAFILVRLI